MSGPKIWTGWLQGLAVGNTMYCSVSLLNYFVLSLTRFFHLSINQEQHGSTSQGAENPLILPSFVVRCFDFFSFLFNVSYFCEAIQIS